MPNQSPITGEIQAASGFFKVNLVLLLLRDLSLRIGGFF
jgi:hypothetical protein